MGIAQRFRRYRTYENAAITDGATYQEVDLYAYGMALSGALWGPIHILEVAMRNAIHDELTRRYRRPDWWNDPSDPLVPFQESMIRSTVSRLARAMVRFGKAPGPEDVVAALEFGFWCGLLGSGDSQHAYERTLWQPAIRHAFPGYKRGRKGLWHEFQRIRLLRNRIGHHEPIHDRDVKLDLTRMLRLITTMSVDLSDFVAAHHRVNDILAKHPRHGHRIDHF